MTSLSQLITAFPKVLTAVADTSATAMPVSPTMPTR